MLRLSNRRSKSNFFLKIELNRNRFFGWHFFDFDSRLYWRRQCTAASSKHDSWAVAKSAEYADLIIRIACRSGRGGRAVLLPATAASRCRVATPPTPVSLTQSLLSPSYVLRGRAAVTDSQCCNFSRFLIIIITHNTAARVDAGSVASDIGILDIWHR